MPLVDENKPRCYYCHKMLDGIEELREHQKAEHQKLLEGQENDIKREPAPGDVTVF